MKYWTKIEVSNLKPDILTGNYEFEYVCDDVRSWSKYPNNSIAGRVNLISNIETHQFCVRYRKPEPKLPSHEEIFSKHWLTDSGIWAKILNYDPEKKRYTMYNSSLTIDWFIGRESKLWPPEDS